MNEPTDAKLLGSKIKRHLISKESYYERGRTVSNRSFYSIHVLVTRLRFIEGRKQSHE